jgi:hypothetical protein
MIPGLVNTQKTIEHGPIEIVDLPLKKWGFSIVMLARLPEGNLIG